MRWFLAVVACLIVAAPAALPASAWGGEWDGVAFAQKSPDGMLAWFVLPTRMVLDDAELPTTRGTNDLPSVYRLTAGRNEHECVQLVLMLGKPLEEVSIEFDDFASGAAMIPADAWRANLVAQVPGRVPPRSSPNIQSWPMRRAATKPEEITPGVYSPTASRRIPDPLLRDATFDLGRGMNRIWLTVRVPKAARPGDYAGAVRVRSAGQTVFEIPLALRVWNHVLPDESSLMVLAEVSSDPPPVTRVTPVTSGARVTPAPALWEHLKPYYDNLKAHRINATGEIYPSAAWQRGAPPPDLREYERALRYVLDELGFARFRFPGLIGVAGGTWQGMAVFEEDLPQHMADGRWISGAAFSQSFPPASDEATGNGTAQWIRLAGTDAAARADDQDGFGERRGERFGEGFGAATLAGHVDQAPAWVEYEFESTSTEPVSVWLQVEPAQAQENRNVVVSVDGQEVGTLSSEQFRQHPLGFARVDRLLTLAPGLHTVRVSVADVAGSADPIYGIFITPSNRPDLDLLLRERARLSRPFKQAFAYHAREMSDWMRRHDWMRKAQARLADAPPAVGEYGRVASVYEMAGQALPSLRRELPQPPSPMLRKSAEVWTVDLSAPAEAATIAGEGEGALKANDELWARHRLLHTLGYPSIAMRLIPWTLGRHGIKGYVFDSVNRWASDPWTDMAQGGADRRDTLIYPDPKTAQPVNSVRWELFREGLEDFETLRLLRTAVDAAYATPNLAPAAKAAAAEAEKLLSDEIASFVRSARDFSWDPAQLEQLRTRAGELLHVLTPLDDLSCQLPANAARSATGN